MKQYTCLALIISLLLLDAPVRAVPVDQATTASDSATTENGSKLGIPSENATNVETQTVLGEAKHKGNGSSTDSVDLEAAATQNQNFLGTVGTVVLPESVANAGSYDPSAVYAGIMSPEAFQQYVNQFGGTYAPYATAAAAAGGYPAPAIYPYPGPYVVQTGYEGYLVPATSPSSGNNVAQIVPAASTIDTEAPKKTQSTYLLDSTSLMSNLVSVLMMSTAFRIVAAIISMLAMVFFSSAITSALCNVTPLCDISSKTVSYLRGRGADDVGRILVEEMTPERVRRATEFVRNAIRKYRQLQKVMDVVPEKND